MSLVSPLGVAPCPVEGASPRTRRLLQELEGLAEAEVAPPDFYGEFLRRALMVLSAAAGGVWAGSPQDGFRLECQMNLLFLGLKTDAARQEHVPLLRQAWQQGRTLHVPPHSSAGLLDGAPAVANPTPFAILIAPVLRSGQVAGLVEVWHAPGDAPGAADAVPLLEHLARLVARYLGNHQARQLAGQQQLWGRLETFTQQLQASLDPTEVAYVVANTGRQLVECDRLSVALRAGRHVRMAAVSGADVVEKHSRLVRRLGRLCERVSAWRERLVYDGRVDPALPPGVLDALNDYLSESNSRLLVVLPLVDAREKAGTAPVRSTLVMECFEPLVPAGQRIARLEVVGRHAVGALYNAQEHRDIPLRWLWRPATRLRDGLGGRGRAWLTALGAALALLAAALVFVPYPLKVEARGQLLPQERRWLYAPVEGQVVRFEEGVQPGARVGENQALVLMHDLQLEMRIVQMLNEIAAAQREIDALASQRGGAAGDADRLRLSAERRQKEFFRDRRLRELRALRERTNADEARPGTFWVKAPQAGTVLSWDFREKLTSRHVRPSEPLLRIGDGTRPWEVELRIPQKHVAQVMRALASAGSGAELDVDLLLVTTPTRVFRGKLVRDQVGGAIAAGPDEPAETEPVLTASVRIDGAGIPAGERIPPDLLVPGTEVHARIRCGDRALGYALFYGLWEFCCEKAFGIF